MINSLLDNSKNYHNLDARPGSFHLNGELKWPQKKSKNNLACLSLNFEKLYFHSISISMWFEFSLTQITQTTWSLLTKMLNANILKKWKINSEQNSIMVLALMLLKLIVLGTDDKYMIYRIIFHKLLYFGKGFLSSS